MRIGLSIATLAACLVPTVCAAQGVHFYPEKAARQERIGLVGLVCELHPDGNISDCEPAYSSTPDFGFEDAAMKMVAAGSFKFKASDIAQQIANNDEAGLARPSPDAAWVGVPVNFQLSGRDNTTTVRWRAEAKVAMAKFMQDHHGKNG
jgi:TonB family protein